MKLPAYNLATQDLACDRNRILSEYNGDFDAWDDIKNCILIHGSYGPYYQWISEEDSGIKNNLFPIEPLLIERPTANGYVGHTYNGSSLNLFSEDDSETIHNLFNSIKDDFQIQNGKHLSFSQVVKVGNYKNHLLDHLRQQTKYLNRINEKLADVFMFYRSEAIDDSMSEVEIHNLEDNLSWFYYFRVRKLVDPDVFSPNYVKSFEFFDQHDAPLEIKKAFLNGLYSLLEEKYPVCIKAEELYWKYLILYTIEVTGIEHRPLDFMPEEFISKLQEDELTRVEQQIKDKLNSLGFPLTQPHKHFKDWFKIKYNLYKNKPEVNYEQDIYELISESWQNDFSECAKHHAPPDESAIRYHLGFK